MWNSLLDLFARLGHWGYLIIFLFPFLESAAFTGLLLPGESVVVFAGFLASQGYLDLGDCLWVISLAAVLGDTAGYFLGKSIGRGYFERHRRLLFLKEKHLKKTEAYFARHGGMTVFLARFTHLLRVMAPFTAGMSRMPYRKFLLFNIAGGVTWTCLFTLLGFYFGHAWQLVEKWAGRAGLFILLMALLVAGFGALYRAAIGKKAEIAEWFRETSESLLAFPPVREFRSRHPRLAVFIRERLSPAGYLGLHLTTGLILSALFVWIFGGIAEDVLNGDPLVQADRWILEQTLYLRTPLATAFLSAVTALGGAWLILTASLLVGFCFLLTKRIPELVVYGIAIGGGDLLMVVLKAALHRPRPAVSTALAQVSGWSLPSGHAMMSILFYGMLAYLWIRRTRSWRLQVLAVSAAGFLVILIGLSRIYLQVHCVSDVLAGYVGGLFWLCVCITGLEAYRKFRRQRGDAPPK